jgi:hypothetical protein
MLSRQSAKSLEAKEKEGNEEEQELTQLAKLAMSDDKLKISAQSVNGATQFRMQANETVLTIEAELNAQSEYDLLRVDLTGGSKVALSMTLPRSGPAAAHTVRSPSALLGLPPELLLHILSFTSNRGEGINPRLLGVSKPVKHFAQDQLSLTQQFLVKHGGNLRAAGYQGLDMDQLAKRTDEEQTFVFTNMQLLHANGYTEGCQINSLAARPDDERGFVLGNAEQLHARGYRNGTEINALAQKGAPQRQFVIDNAQVLHGSGYEGYTMNVLADRPAAEQAFVIAHAANLHSNGYDRAFHINDLAALPVASRNFVLANAEQLHAAGYGDGEAMNKLAQRPAAERQVALNNALMSRAPIRGTPAQP